MAWDLRARVTSALMDRIAHENHHRGRPEKWRKQAEQEVASLLAPQEEARRKLAHMILVATDLRMTLSIIRDHVPMDAQYLHKATEAMAAFDDAVAGARLPE